jgi:hypothetical protein
VALVLVCLSGCATTTGPAAAVQPWSAPVGIEPAGASAGSSSVYGVSCPSSTSCMAVDENGSALRWHDGKWASPQPVEAGGTLTSVSCAAVTFCVALSDGGEGATYDGRSWSAPVVVGPPATYQVSCPTVTFCAAVGASGASGGPSTVATFNGHAWSTFATPASGAADNRILDVSCATARVCVAVNLDGQALVFDGSRWSPSPALVAPGLTSVSCPTASFCLAVTMTGKEATFDGTSWSTPGDIPGFQSAFAYAVSCGSAKVCTVLGLSGRAARWQQGRWSRPVVVFPGRYLATVSVSCADAESCVAVNADGRAATS